MVVILDRRLGHDQGAPVILCRILHYFIRVDKLLAIALTNQQWIMLSGSLCGLKLLVLGKLELCREPLLLRWLRESIIIVTADIHPILLERLNDRQVLYSSFGVDLRSGVDLRRLISCDNIFHFLDLCDTLNPTGKVSRPKVLHFLLPL